MTEVWKIATAVGGVLVLLGAILIPLPGPGWLVLSLGLIVLLAALIVRLAGGR